MYCWKAIKGGKYLPRTGDESTSDRRFEIASAVLAGWLSPATFMKLSQVIFISPLSLKPKDGHNSMDGLHADMI